MKAANFITWGDENTKNAYDLPKVKSLKSRKIEEGNEQVGEVQ